MKNLVKIWVFSLFLLWFSVISPNVHAESWDTYTVNFVTNGGWTVDSQTVEEWEMLDVSVISVHKDGYSFSWWYTESGFVNEFNIDTDPVMSDLTLYAKWREHTIRVIYHAKWGVNWSNWNPVPDLLPYV